MNVKEVVQQAFIDEWANLGGLKNQINVNQIENHFNLSAVQFSINQDIKKYIDEAARERYHIMNLRKLAQNYAKILYIESHRGTELYETKIFSARSAMKAQGPCDDVYPC